MPHKLLSENLEELLAKPAADGRLTMNVLLERTEGRGIYLLMIVLCLPYVAPLPIAGTSTFLGGIITILAFRLALFLPARLPSFIGERPLPFDRFPKLGRGSVCFLRFLEKWVKPRNTTWLGWPLVRSANALLLTFMAFLLALPLPIPATNLLPAYAIVILAASMMEEDGRMIWAGYAVSLITVFYFLLSAKAIALFFHKYYQWFLDHFPF